VASGIARLSLLLVAIAGFTLIMFLATHGYDRAVLLIPTWLLLLVWVVAAGLTVSGAVQNDIVAPALLGGLVLIVMLIGFTLEQRRGRLVQDFRLRTPDGHYLWFTLKARPVVGSDGEVVRLVGTLTDVTESKTAEERLLHDSVHDNLTGLPNRQLFLDRLDAVLALAKADPAIKPTVMMI